ncbi:MAG: DNA repair protein RadA [Thiotrichales bacterium]|nr:DNA repair protein RadA [Thiotrichales bacterium]
MAKVKTQHQCSECGAMQPKWAGQCADCGAWNTLQEVSVEKPSTARRLRFQDGLAETADPCQLSEVGSGRTPRISSGLAELDRAIGGGLVSGSVLLLGGDPGIGKSTLLIQVLARLGGAEPLASLYVTAEESREQVSLRARRLELEAERIRILTENRLERIFTTLGKERPGLLVIDSIQTVYTDTLQSAPGAVAQVRECTAQLVRYAKQTGTIVILVGHVTKEGSLAGPRVLEHMVDTVLYFEGDSASRFRLVRAVKNRYGAVNELGVFAMTEQGLKEVNNPSAIFLSRHEEAVSGSVVMVSREGTRPILLELQALVDESHLSQPRRLTVGLDHNRLAMLLAVLHRHAGIVTYDQDIFVNAVGGVRVNETASDLGVVLAILSSLKNRPLPQGLVVFGEIGLAGEIRPVQNGEDRLREAEKHGFTRAIIPAANRPKHSRSALKIDAVSKLSQVLDLI